MRKQFTKTLAVLLSASLFASSVAFGGTADANAGDAGTVTEEKTDTGTGTGDEKSADPSYKNANIDTISVNISVLIFMPEKPVITAFSALFHLLDIDNGRSSSR